jgi:fibronectin-binding autotransporter adhesin
MSRRDARKSSLMGRRTILALAAAAAGPMFFSPQTAQATSYTWSNVGTGATPVDGGGAWDTTAHWFSGGVESPWTNSGNDTAVFGAGGTGGTVTLPQNVTVGGIVFNTPYVLGASTGGIGSISLSGNNPTPITVNSATATINAVMNGNSADFIVSPTSTLTSNGVNFAFTGWTKDGGGTISIGSSSMTGGFGGAINLNSGTIVVAGSAGTFNNAVTVNTGAGSAAIASAGNATFNGAISGSGTLYLFGGGTSPVITVQGQDFSQFTGTFAISGSTNATTFRYNVNNGTGTATIFDLKTNGSIVTKSTNGTIELGGLTGSAASNIQGSQSNSNTTTYEIGAANVDTIFSGLIENGSGVASRTAAIVKNGTAKLTLSGTNTYTGITQINSGTLAVTIPNVFTTPSIQVNHQTFNNIIGGPSTGTFDVSAVSGGYTILNGQTLTGNGGNIYGTINVQNTTGFVNPGTNATGLATAGTLNFHDTLNMTGGTNGGTLAFDLSNSTGGGNDQLSVGSLEASTTTLSHIIISPLSSYAPANSEYDLLNYTGSNLTPAQLASAFTLASTTAGVFQLDTTVAGEIQVKVVSLVNPLTLRWTGVAGTGTTWDLGLSANFTDSSSNVTSFHQGDNVTFDDTAGVQTTISLSGSLTPSSLHFNNSVNNYVFTGNGVGTIGGNTSVVKDGTASVTFSNANGFLGGTTINNGTLRITVPNALGDPANGAQPVVLNGGTLGVDNTISFGLPINVTKAGSTISSVGNASLNNQVSAVNLLVNLDIPGTSVLSFLPQVFTNASPVTNTGLTGTMTVDATSGGVLRMQGSMQDQYEFFDLGLGSVTLALRDPSTVQIGGIAGGSLTSIRGPIGSNGTGTFVFGGTGGGTDSPTGVSTYAGTIGNGSTSTGINVLNISKNVPAWTLALTGNNTYTGSTTLNEGTLLVNGTHIGGNTYIVANGATFGGNGRVSATIDLSGSMVPGNTGSVGTLTIGTFLNENGSSINFEVGGGKADQLVVTGVGTNTSGLNFTNNSVANISVSDLGNATYGRYVLIDYNAGASGGTLSSLANFNANNGGAITIHGVASSLVNNTLNTSVDLYVPNPGENDSSWIAGTSNQWQTGVTGNWANAIVPANADDVAIFTDTGAGTVNLANAETVAFVNINTNTGSYNIGGSTLTLDASGGYVGVNVQQNGNQTISAPVVLGKSAIFAINDPASLTVSSNISDNEGAGSLTNGLSKSGNGMLTLTGSNTYSGPTSINNGVLAVNNNNAIGDASSTNVLNLQGGTFKTLTSFTSPATRTVFMQSSSTVDTTGNTVEIDGQLLGTGTLTDTGNGTLLLTANNGFAGALKINSGTVVVASTGNIGNSSSTNHLVFNGGAMIMTGTYTSGRDVILSQVGTIDTNGNVGSITGTISSSGGLVKQGAGTLTLAASNTFTGQVTITGGAVDIISDAGLGGGNGTASVTSSSNASSSVTLSALPAGLAIGSNFLGSTVTGISGSSPTFTVTLAGNANTNLTNGTASFATAFPVTLSGGSLVQIGTFALNESNNLGVSVPSAFMNRNVVMAGNGTYSTGSNVGTITGSITGTGDFTKTGSGTLMISGPVTHTGSVILNAGTLLMPGTYGYSGAMVVNGGTATLTGPASWNATALASSQTATNGSIVNGGRLIYNYASTVANDPAATVQAALTAGFNQATRFSTSLIRTTNAIDNFHGLGWKDDGTTAVTVAYTYYGDSDLSGTVDITDFNTLALNYGTTGATWQKGDFNYDGTVNGLDLNAIATNFGATPALDVIPLGALLSADSSGATPLGALVPEPASLGMIALGAGMLVRRRRR